MLRYWEQEFSQLKPMKRRGNRRYYQHHEVLLVRRIRDLLYDQGFTISGARNRLSELGHGTRLPAAPVGVDLPPEDEADGLEHDALAPADAAMQAPALLAGAREFNVQQVRQELQSIRELLAP